MLNIEALRAENDQVRLRATSLHHRYKHLIVVQLFFSNLQQITWVGFLACFTSLPIFLMIVFLPVLADQISDTPWRLHLWLTVMQTPMAPLLC